MVRTGGWCCKFSFEFKSIYNILILFHANRAFKAFFNGARSLITDCISRWRGQNSRAFIVYILNFCVIFFIVPLRLNLIDSFLVELLVVNICLVGCVLLILDNLRD